MFNLKLHWQVLIAMIAGAFVAMVFGERALIFSPLGTIFMKLLKMVIVPLILFSVTSGVTSIGDSNTLGRMGIKVFGYYMLTSILAILVGLSLTNLLQPGKGINFSVDSNKFDPSTLSQPNSLADIIIRMIPSNPIKAMADGEILALIFWSIVLGIAITQISDKPKKAIIKGFDYGFELMMKLTQGIISFLPIGVFGLIINAIVNSGIDLFKVIGFYWITIAIGLSIHWLIILPLVFYSFTKINPIKHWKAMSSAFITAFSTSTSLGTLPVTMNCLKKNIGVSNKTSSFVLPLGATINMDGTALYECAGVLFISQVLGAELEIYQQFIIVITAFLASIGTAAIPSAGLVMIFIVLDAVGLSNNPEVPIIVGAMLAVDRPLDMFRTVINITSDSIGAVILAKSENEKNLYKKL
ncbi:MAG: dicarboxylate/amino acid:cation symporter [Candidatus Marinimicrobia bacterium]|nr:dicarboxylate/amino acid:cation symporter [Candidatus Neomarinimicrobiota bacterium]OUW50886.1 MAG: hypothetical protein CBD50_01230 [bacterium TMED190]